MISAILGFRELSNMQYLSRLSITKNVLINSVFFLLPNPTMFPK